MSKQQMRELVIVTIIALALLSLSVLVGFGILKAMGVMMALFV